MAINTAGMAFPKPGDRDGLVKLSPAKYRKHKEKVWLSQNKRCAKCKCYIADVICSQLHHTDGRGLGGGKRDDRKTVILCNGCHAKEHNQ
jgi:hypothetical protein